MRYKKMIVIICLLTFLLLPYQKPKANDAAVVMGGLASGGLATVSASTLAPALIGLAVASGICYVGYNVHKMVIDFCEDYEEENGFSVWDAVTGQANNGKIAISSKLVEDFTAYGENYIHAGEVKLSVDTSHLGQTISVKAGTTPRYYTAGVKYIVKLFGIETLYAPAMVLP